MDWAEAANKRRPGRKRAVRKERVAVAPLDLSDKVAAKSQWPSSALRAKQGQMERAETRGIQKVKVPDPENKGSTEPVQKRVIDPIEILYGKDLIDDGQRDAAHRIRKAVEAMGEGVGSVDASRIRVDCAGKGDPVPRMLDAGDYLKQVRALLGREYYDIVRRITGDGETLSQVAKDYAMTAQELANGGVGQGTRDYVSRALRRALRIVADEM